MRDRGYRLLQIWVPDVRSERFAAEVSRQSRAVAAADMRSDDQSFIEAVNTPWDE
jgi:hypothetical protein